MSANNIAVTNQALAEIGTRSQITSLGDGSPEANYASLLYNPLRDFLLREGDYEFATSPIIPTAISTPFDPWLYAYQYPLDCVRVKQLLPANYFSIVNDPQPVPFNISNMYSQRSIVTRRQIGLLIYTTNGVAEEFWDPMFTEAMVRMLAAALAFALENRIELSNEKLQEAINFAGMASLKDG